MRGKSFKSEEGRVKLTKTKTKTKTEQWERGSHCSYIDLWISLTQRIVLGLTQTAQTDTEARIVNVRVPTGWLSQAERVKSL